MSQTVEPEPAGRANHRLKRRSNERVQLLGGEMDLMKSAEIFYFVSKQIRARRKTLIANHNFHSLYLIRKSAELRAFFNKADVVEVDSIPLILWGRLIIGRGRRFHRCTYLDWRDEFWTSAMANRWRVFFVGGAPGVGEKAIERLSSDWPGVQIASHHGFFDIDPISDENTAVIDKVNAFKPHILLVGMGMPRQELWILRNHARLDALATFTLGGGFDYEAGVQPACPRWVGQLGLEWLFRLAMNPRRLVFRYCVEPWSLLGPALVDIRRALRLKIRPIR